MVDKEYSYYVYILTNKMNTVFYTGFTNNIIRRVVEHKMKLNDGFTNKYNINKLIYYEHFTDVNCAIEREKKLKKWNRAWKMRLIKKENSDMHDLIYDFASEEEIKELINDMKKKKLEDEMLDIMMRK